MRRIEQGIKKSIRGLRTTLGLLRPGGLNKRKRAELVSRLEDVLFHSEG